jgi:hypothetical protein
MKLVLPALFGFSALFVLAVSCGKGSNSIAENEGSDTQEAWNKGNDPIQMSSSYERVLSKLPTSSALPVKPWTDTYWPTEKGGIAHRWQTTFKGTGYQLYTVSELKTLDSKILDKLSPAEKYDILMGDYTYPLTTEEKKRTAGKHESWEGICHGWAPAAYLYQEPAPIKLTNKDGIVVSFGSSDIKALLSLYQGNYSNAPSRGLGDRCNASFSKNLLASFRKECRDTNAGAFHLVLANEIGVRKKSFVVDATRDAEVWNQPVHSFQSIVQKYQRPSFKSAKGTVREAVVKTEMSYTLEVNPHFQMLNGTNGYNEKTRVYRYVLELDKSDAIIGGRWISSDRPDFLWTSDLASFEGYFSGLQLLAKPAQ